MFGLLVRFLEHVQRQKVYNHWFEKDSFIFDFSLIDKKENMVKVLFPGSAWDKSKFKAAFQEASDKLKLMNKPKMELKTGKI